MKKVIIGSFMLLTGVLSCAVLLAASMSRELPAHIIVGEGNIPTTFMDIFAEYSLTPAFYIFMAIAVIGIVVSAWGLLEKK